MAKITYIEHNGTEHVVDVIDGVYHWNGHAWKSLSVIAREITGARWSGPRQFVWDPFREGGNAFAKRLPDRSNLLSTAHPIGAGNFCCAFSAVAARLTGDF